MMRSFADNDKQVVMLIDTGSSHNFISWKVGKYLHLPSKNQYTLRGVTSGTHMNSSRLCNELPLQILGHSFVIHFYILPLNDFGVVLGTKWLRTFGTTQWNFKKFTMDFSLDGKKVTFNGLKASFQVNH